MIALDTNILARFYVNDKESAPQREAAKRLMEGDDEMFVPRTVMLELEWVMRGFYGFKPTDVADAMEHLLGLQKVLIEDAPMIERAVKNYRRGLDFADAMHLASAGGCSGFATFDKRRFANRANKLGLKPACFSPMNGFRVKP